MIGQQPNKILSISDLLKENEGSGLVRHWINGSLYHSYVLICLGEVQKSGAMVYFRPSNNDFTCNQKTYFKSYDEAYQSENW